MAVDANVPRTRRALLTAAAVGAAAAAIGRVAPARAEDETMVVGGEYNSTSVTRLTNTTNDDTVLRGSSTRAGIGVYGTSDSGSGLEGYSQSGIGLRIANGRFKADQVSGVATIAAGATSKVVAPGVDIVTGSFVLLTPMTNIGSRALWFTKNTTDDTFTIRLSSSRSSTTKVAWLLLG